MTEIEIRRIGENNAADARLKNEPFTLWGRLIPSLNNGEWDYTTARFPVPETDCFPDEPYDPATDDAIFLGAYEGETCVGLAVLRQEMFSYLYLDDLKVVAAKRGQGVGGKLIAAAMNEASRLGLRGVYTVGQDNNLSACLFYLRQGFAIGGFDNRSYGGTKQEGKANVFFYKDL